MPSKKVALGSWALFLLVLFLSPELPLGHPHLKGATGPACPGTRNVARAFGLTFPPGESHAALMVPPRTHVGLLPRHARWDGIAPSLSVSRRFRNLSGRWPDSMNTRARVCASQPPNFRSVYRCRDSQHNPALRAGYGPSAPMRLSCALPRTSPRAHRTTFSNFQNEFRPGGLDATVANKSVEIHRGTNTASVTH